MSGIKQRNYGIDLLRITSMFMVVILHVIGQGGMMSSTSGMTISYEITRFVWTAAYCAVNCYALISGYVGCNSTFKLSNLIKLWIQVMFTCVTITAIFAIYNPSTVSFQSWINAFFPVMRKQFWYFTSYFCIFFFTPLMNKIINSVPRSTLRNSLIVTFILFSIIQWFAANDTFNVSYGYSPLWLAVMYLAGGYIKKYDVCKNISSLKLLVTYGVCVLAGWVEIYIFESFYRSAENFYYGTPVIYYTSPQIIIAGICLLLLFSRIKMYSWINKIIKIVAPLTFGVYIIHTHPLIWDNLFKNAFATYINSSPLLIIVQILGSALAIFFLCILIEFIRYNLFKLIKIDKISEKVAKKISVKYSSINKKIEKIENS